MYGALEGFAFDEGVRVGDRILEVDGEATRDLSVEQVKVSSRGLPACMHAHACRRHVASPERHVTSPGPRIGCAASRGPQSSSSCSVTACRLTRSSFPCGASSCGCQVVEVT